MLILSQVGQKLQFFLHLLARLKLAEEAYANFARLTKHVLVLDLILRVVIGAVATHEWQTLNACFVFLTAGFQFLIYFSLLLLVSYLALLDALELLYEKTGIKTLIGKDATHLHNWTKFGSLQFV